MKPKKIGDVVELREDGFGPVVERLKVVGPMAQAKLRDVPAGALAYFPDHPEVAGWFEADWEKGRDSDDETVWFVPCVKLGRGA